jgi:hypothetical protein
MIEIAGLTSENCRIQLSFLEGLAGLKSKQC